MSVFTSLRSKHEPHFSLPSLTASLLCSFSLIPVIRHYLCSPTAGWNRATVFKIHLDVLFMREKLQREEGIHGRRRLGKLPSFSPLPPRRTDWSVNTLCAFYTYFPYQFNAEKGLLWLVLHMPILRHQASSQEPADGLR